MAYQRSNLISRPGYSGMDGLWDDITGAAGKVFGAWGAQQQAVGAQQQAAQQNRDLTNAIAAQQGISTSTIVIGAGAVLIGYLLLRKKRTE